MESGYLSLSFFYQFIPGEASLALSPAPDSNFGLASVSLIPESEWRTSLLQQVS